MSEIKMDLSLNKWRKKLSIVLWIAALLTVALEATVFFLLQDDIALGILGRGDVTGYLWKFLYIPSAIMVLVAAANSWIQHMAHDEKTKNYGLLITALIMCFVVNFVHYVAPLVLATYVLPVFITILFADKKTTRVISFSALLLMSVNLLRGSMYAEQKLYFINILAAYALLIVSYILTTALMQYIQASQQTVHESYLKQMQSDEQAKRDSLTNLYNQKMFLESISGSIAHSQQTGEPFCVAMVDLDNFKSVNDTFGHAAGNDVLVQLSELMYQLKMESVRGEVQLFRFGGEEFGILFHNHTAEQAKEQMEFLRTRFAKVRYLALGDYHVTLSAGVLPYSGEATADVVFKAADAALYQAKHNGKNQTVVGSL